MIEFRGAEPGRDCDITIKIKNSVVDLQCDMNKYERSDLSHVHKVAYDLARTAVNILTFASGMTQTIILDQLVDVDGTVSAFVIHDPTLGALCTAYAMKDGKTDERVQEILKIVVSEPALFSALDHLITATSLHHFITVNSARSVEALRHAMAGSEMSRSKAWEMFRTNLNIDHDYLRLITDHSQAGRHGETKFVPGTITTEIIHRAWSVMNRFLEFRVRGNKPLPLADFPLLTG